jgi:hypothetical protein
MSQWLVTQGDNQFPVEGLSELKQLASDGRLGSGDMVQPPGATDWLYAAEIPELKGMLQDGAGGSIDEFDSGLKKGMSTAVMGILAMVFLGVAVVGGGTMYFFYQQLPSGNETLFGDGGLAFTEMLTTVDAPLRSEPENSSSAIESLPKDTKLLLLAKRGDFYKARRSTGGAEGWVTLQEVVPLYKLGDIKVRDKYDPLYNPDQYVSVKNASWQMIDEEGNDVTTFTFLMHNDSRYPMTGLVLEAVIKDSKGNEVGKTEFAIEGMLPAKDDEDYNGTVWVGTLGPENEKDPEAVGQLLTQATFDEMAEEDEDLNLRWVLGVELHLEEDFTEAVVRVVELRAIPPA